MRMFSVDIFNEVSVELNDVTEIKKINRTRSKWDLLLACKLYMYTHLLTDAVLGRMNKRVRDTMTYENVRTNE